MIRRLRIVALVGGLAMSGCSRCQTAEQFELGLAITAIILAGLVVWIAHARAN